MTGITAYRPTQDTSTLKKASVHIDQHPMCRTYTVATAVACGGDGAPTDW